MKFTIVTPSYNSQRFIRETIESVITQKGNFSIEYIIGDNCSSDKTKQIAEEYINLSESGKLPISCNDVSIKFISQKDSGMYEAIQNGFSQASGDIYAWINADDIYLPGAFDIIQRAFFKYSQIKWLKGITSLLNENSNIFAAGQCYLYHQDWISKGLYGTILQFIQQDSVFWRAEQWKSTGGLDTTYSAAGDFFLWRKFAKLTPLYSLNSFVSCFRINAGQKSEDIDAYWHEIHDYNLIKRKYKLIKCYSTLESIIPRSLRVFCYKLIPSSHHYYLITLENNIEPCLKMGTYYNMKMLL